MATRTVLDMTQGILAEMSSDKVNSITDTNEASDVVTILHQVFDDIVSQVDLPKSHALFRLNASGTTARPTHMDIPDSKWTLEVLKYDKKDSLSDPRNFREIYWLEPEDFMELVYKRDSSESNVDTVSDPSGVELLIYNDKNPTYYTMFDEEAVVMDAYDSALESTLQQSKTACWGRVLPAFTETDAHVINLPDQVLSLLYNEALSRAYVSKKQTTHGLADRTARRLWALVQDTKYRKKRRFDQPNYGRNPNRVRRHS